MRALGKVVAIVCCLLFAAASRAEDQQPRTPLEWAEQLVAHVRPENNEYVYRPIHVSWKGQHGAADWENHADCSGFYTHLLEQSYGWDAATFKRWMGTTRPVARTIHDTIVAERGFVRIRSVHDLRPGDVIAMKYQPTEKDTGHVMLVASEAKPHEASEPIVPGTLQWEITIIDSSKSGHGPTDTRRKADKTFYQGVGKGVARLYTDEKGELVGYSWSVLPKSTYQGPDKHLIAAGRLDPDYKP
jgi:hypothetical protein